MVRKSGILYALRDGGLFDSAGRASTIGLHMVSGVLVGGVIGYALDRWLDASPWFKLIFFTLGVAAGFRNVYLDSKLLLQRSEDLGGVNPESGRERNGSNGASGKPDARITDNDEEKD